MQGLEARINMVKQQLRTWQITEQRILQIIEKLPREQFVPKAYHDLSYSDYAIPLNNNEIMLPPSIVGKALQLLNIQATDKVLEIGTGTGYITALLSFLAKHVFSMEIDSMLFKQAKNNLSALHYNNITLAEGDAHDGWLAEGDYDCIFVTGAYPIELPEILKTQVRVGGRIFAFIGTSPVVEARLYTQPTAQTWQMRSLFETEVPALVNAKHPKLFNF